MSEVPKIRFRDLGGGLKTLVVLLWIYLVLNLLGFLGLFLEELAKA